MTCPNCGCQAPLTEETAAGYYEPVSKPDPRKEASRMRCQTVGCREEATTSVVITMLGDTWEDEVCQRHERYFLMYSDKLEWHAEKPR